MTCCTPLSSTAITGLLDLLLMDDVVLCDFVHLISIIDTSSSMVSILNIEHISSFFDVINTTKECVHLFERHASGFWNDEDDENHKQGVYASEEIECVTGEG